jgi:MOSC domain-containing protein YiiM
VGLSGEAFVAAVSCVEQHALSKQPRDSIHLVAGLGVEGDAHLGDRVQHRSRKSRDPTQPNLRQVHLIHAELHDELRAAGFHVSAGDMGENVTTRGIDLLTLPTGTKLALGESVRLTITGLRNPCVQLEHFEAGLMDAVLDRDDHGALIRKAGVMSVVEAGGEVRPGDPISIELPQDPHHPLAPV